MEKVRLIDGNEFEKCIVKTQRLYEILEGDASDAYRVLDSVLATLSLQSTLDGYEPVVYCKNCVSHGCCDLETAFAIFGLDKRFCAAGLACKEVRA